MNNTNLRNKYFTFIIAMLSVFQIQAQTDITDWESSFQTIEDVDEEEVENWEMQYEELSDLIEHKIDINSATREDLLRLPFLSNQQVMDIMEYMYHYGSMKSLAELAMIRSIDYETRQLLAQCLFVGDKNEEKKFPSLSNIAKYGRHQIIATGHIPCYDHKGDKWGYLGYNYKHWIKYEFKYGKWIKAGVMMSQDAGEPFFAGKNKWGYDYMSPYMLIKDLGKVKTLAIGRYKARFGMGLVMNNSFSMGKQASLASIGRVSRGLYAHASRQEGNYMQGIGATVETIHNLDVTGFLSYRKIDATINSDDNSISTILKTGYHRSATEMLRRRNASQAIMGGNIYYHVNGFHFGITGYQTSFDKPLHPDTTKLYKLIAPWGKRFWNIGADYAYLSRRISINGEVATGNSKGIATINSINYMVNSNLTLVAIQRFYSYKYYSLMASSFSEGRSVQNESGVYLGAKWQPIYQLTFSHYFDWAYFPWPKYLATATTRTFDMQHSATWSKNTWSITARYRLKTWNKDSKDDNDNKFLDRITQHRIRLTITKDNKLLFLRTQGDISLYHKDENSFGYMVMQQVGIRKNKMQAYTSLAYFKTDDYNSRVYTYERSTLYNLSFPALYGEGIRFAATIRADFSSNLMAIAKVGGTHRIDNNKIGSGLQAIETKTPIDVDLQLRWKF